MVLYPYGAIRKKPVCEFSLNPPLLVLIPFVLCYHLQLRQTVSPTAAATLTEHDNMSLCSPSADKVSVCLLASLPEHSSFFISLLIIVYMLIQLASQYTVSLLSTLISNYSSAWQLIINDKSICVHQLHPRELKSTGVEFQRMLHMRLSCALQLCSLSLSAHPKVEMVIPPKECCAT